MELRPDLPKYSPLQPGYKRILQTKERMRANVPREAIRWAYAMGHDTFSYARAIRATEADVWNSMARSDER